jgi:hypothetical protein
VREARARDDEMAMSAIHASGRVDADDDLPRTSGPLVEMNAVFDLNTYSPAERRKML